MFFDLNFKSATGSEDLMVGLKAYRCYHKEQKFTKEQASFLFGINPAVLEQMSFEQKRDFVKNQLKVNGEQINKKLSMQLFGNESEKELIYVTQDGRSISGKIFWTFALPACC